MANFDVKTIVKDKRFWVASFLIAWAAALQGHMMWLQKQDSFKEKFGTIDEEDNKATKTQTEKTRYAHNCLEFVMLFPVLMDDMRSLEYDVEDFDP